MKHYLLTFFGIFIFCYNVFGQAKWTKFYSAVAINNSITRTNDNGYLLVGNTSRYGPSGYGASFQNPVLIKTDSVGNMVWQKVYGTNQKDAATKVVQVPNGDIFVLGSISFSSTSQDITLTKFDEYGNLIWEHTYGDSYIDQPGSMVADGNDVVILATLNGPGSTSILADILLFKVNNNGVTLWTRIHGSASTHETGYGLSKLHDGGFLLSGQYRNGAIYKAYAIRTNAVGDTLWTKVVEAVGSSTMSGVGLWDCTQLLGDTVLVFVGRAPTYFGNLCVVRMDLNGNVLNTFISDFLCDDATHVTPLADGGFIVAGLYTNFEGVAAVYRFHEWSNNFIWQRRYFQMGGTSSLFYSNATCVLAHDDGGYVIGGSVSIFDKTKMFLMKIDAWGNNTHFGNIMPTVSQPDTVCTGTTINISVPNVFDHYKWYRYNNVSNVNNISNSDTSSINVDSSRYYRCVMWNDDSNYIVSGQAYAIVSNFPDTTITNIGSLNKCPPSNILQVYSEPGTIINWFHNGNLILSGPGELYSPSASGTYTAQLSNACTTFTTAPVQVSLVQPVINIGPDTVFLKYYYGSTGGCETAYLDANSSNGSIYRWYKNGVQLPNTMAVLEPNTEGYYYATVLNACGLTFSDTTWVIYDTIYSPLTYHPSYSLTGCVNSSLELSMVGFGNGNALSWSWYKDGVLVAQQFLGDPGAGRFMPSSVLFGSLLDSGYYYCIVTNYCGNFLFHHESESVYYKEDQSSKIINVVGGGSPITCFGNSLPISVSQANSVYQWYKDSVAIPGATQQQLVVTSSGQYMCQITRSCGQYFTNSMKVWIGIPPAIIISNAAGLCFDGADSTIVRLQSQTISGVNTFQWRRDGVNIPGATSYYFDTKIPGIYDCIFSFSCSTIYSNSIILNLFNIPKTIIADNNGKFCPGGTIELHATPGFSYQWYKRINTVYIPIPAANNSSLLTDSATSYYAIISNGLCSLKSNNKSVSHQVIPFPNYIMPTTPPVSCGNGPVNLVANTRPDFSYQWLLNGLPINGATSSEHLASGTGEFTVVIYDSINCASASEPIYVNDSYSGNVSLTIGVLSNHCAGDTITIGVNGSYQAYQWYYNNIAIQGATTPTLVTDSAGHYTVLATDSIGCSGTATSSVSFLPAPYITNIVSSPAYCSAATGSLNIYFSTMVDLFITGPTTIFPQYGISYSINNSLLPGWYYISYNFSGGYCAFVDSIEVLATGTIPVQINAGTGTICPGQNINAGSGSSGLQYLWSTGQTSFNINPQSTGWYTLIVTDSTAGCAGIDSVYVTVLPSPIVNIQPPGPIAMCGPSVVVSLDAGSGFIQYLWSNGHNTQTISTYFPGNYIVTVTDLNGCTNHDTVLITNPPLPYLTNTANGPTSFCVGGSVDLSVTGSIGNLQWHRYNIPIAGATASTHTVTSAGSYHCFITDINGCTAFSNAITVTTPCQPPQDPVDKIASDEPSSSGIIVHPNPGSDVFELIIDESLIVSEFKIVDLSGRTVLNSTGLSVIDMSIYRFDLSFTKSGIYFIHITDQNQQLHRLKLIKL